MNTRSKWLGVAPSFGALLLGAGFLCYLPTAINRTQTPYGLGAICGAYLILAMKAAIRVGLAFAITVLVLPLAPPIGWRQMWAVALLAVVCDLVSERLATTIAGTQASGLVAAPVAFAIALLVSVVVLRSGPRHAV